MYAPPRKTAYRKNSRGRGNPQPSKKLDKKKEYPVAVRLEHKQFAMWSQDFFPYGSDTPWSVSERPCFQGPEATQES